MLWLAIVADAYYLSDKEVSAVQDCVALYVCLLVANKKNHDTEKYSVQRICKTP